MNQDHFTQDEQLMIQLQCYSKQLSLKRTKTIIEINQKTDNYLNKVGLHDQSASWYYSYLNQLLESTELDSVSINNETHAPSQILTSSFGFLTLFHWSILTLQVLSFLISAFHFSFLIFLFLIFLFYCILHPNWIFLISDSKHSLELFVHLFLLQIFFSCFILGKIRILIIIQQHIDHDTLTWFTQVFSKKIILSN